MDRICQYSTIIFAGNVSVLLIVAISTDYWEYRGFKTEELIPRLKKMHSRLKLYFPSDTSSYFVVKYYWDPPPIKTSIFATTPIPKREVITANYTLVYYQPPVLLTKKIEEYIETEFFYQFDGNSNSNVTVAVPTKKKRSVEDSLVLYVQYTNLFRECDILEVGVRERLGLSSLRSHRCFNFITTTRTDEDYVLQEIPAAMHLERIAFIMSLVCIAVSLISLVSGAYGLIAHNRSYILTASSAACASGIAMTVSIAIFHGKCHLVHRHDFLAGIELPFKKTVEELRDYYYGWSFVLAWICVILCFVHTWVWLAKAQDMPDICLPSGSRWGQRLLKLLRRKKKKKWSDNLPGAAVRKKPEGPRKRGSLTRWGSTRYLNIQNLWVEPGKVGIQEKTRGFFSQEESIYCSIATALRKTDHHIHHHHAPAPPVVKRRRWSDGATRGPTPAQRAKLEAAAMSGVSVGNIYRNHIDTCSMQKFASGEYYKVLQRPKSEFKILVQPTDFKMYKEPCDCEDTAWRFPSEGKLTLRRFSRCLRAMRNTRQAHIHSVNTRSQPHIHSVNLHSINIRQTAKSLMNISNAMNHYHSINRAKSQLNMAMMRQDGDMMGYKSQPAINMAYSQGHIDMDTTYSQPAINTAYSQGDIDTTYSHIGFNKTTRDGSFKHRDMNKAYSQDGLEGNYSHDMNKAYSQDGLEGNYSHDMNKAYSQDGLEGRYDHRDMNRAYSQDVLDRNYSHDMNKAYSQDGLEGGYSQREMSKAYSQADMDVTYSYIDKTHSKVDVDRQCNMNKTYTTAEINNVCSQSDVSQGYSQSEVSQGYSQSKVSQGYSESEVSHGYSQGYTDRTYSQGDLLHHDDRPTDLYTELQCKNSVPTMPTSNSQMSITSVKSPTMSVTSPIIGVKSPNIGVKSPNIGVKSPTLCGNSPIMFGNSPIMSGISPTTGMKSPTMSGKSPTLYDKSPSLYDKSPTLYDKSPTLCGNSYMGVHSDGVVRTEHERGIYHESSQYTSGQSDMTVSANSHADIGMTGMNSTKANSTKTNSTKPNSANMNSTANSTNIYSTIKHSKLFP